jgi:hypothetical protein
MWERKPSPDKMPALIERKSASKMKGLDKDSRKEQEGRVVAPIKEQTKIPHADKNETQDMLKAMMGFISGLSTSLEAVAGGMKEMQADQRDYQQHIQPVQVLPHEKVTRGPVLRESHEPMVYQPMGSNKSPAQYVKERTSEHQEWYAVAKGKDGASGVLTVTRRPNKRWFIECREPFGRNSRRMTMLGCTCSSIWKKQDILKLIGTME